MTRDTARSSCSESGRQVVFPSCDRLVRFSSNLVPIPQFILEAASHGGLYPTRDQISPALRKSACLHVTDSVLQSVHHKDLEFGIDPFFFFLKQDTLILAGWGCFDKSQV